MKNRDICKKITSILISKKFFFCVSYFFFLYISFNIPFVADDFSYAFSKLTGERIVSVIDIIKSLSFEYCNWNGRILGYFFTELFMMKDIGIWIFRLLYPIVNTIILELIHRIVNEKSNSNYYIALSLLLSGHILMLNQTVFWICGWSIYVLALPCILYSILSFKKTLIKQKQNYVLLYISNFCGCLFVEHYSLLILGFSICVFVYNIYKKDVTKQDVFALMFSLMGNAVVFLAPGLSARASQDLTAAFSFSEKLYFGWTRFIYCFFYMNQRVFLILSSSLLLVSMKNKKYINSLSLILTSVFSFLLIFTKSIFNPYLYECLTGEWTFYTCEPSMILKGSIIVVVYSLIIFVNILILLDEKIFSFILIMAIICSNACFITSNMACERTMFVGNIMLIILAMESIYSIGNIIVEKSVVVLFILILIYSCLKMVNNYSEEYSIFLENEERLREALASNKDTVYIVEHNYGFIFKSDLDFNEQDSWLLEGIRKYYGLDENVKILGE